MNCKYCSDKNKAIESVKSDLDATAFIDEENNELSVCFSETVYEANEIDDEILYYIDVKINYCPMCGRKLKDETEN